MATQFEFILSDPLSNPKPGKKSSQIRSHCMQGKNKREGSRRSKREAKILAQTKAEAKKDHQLLQPPNQTPQDLISTIPPSTLLQTTQFADPTLSLQSKALILTHFAHNITNQTLSPFSSCVDFTTIENQNQNQNPTKPFRWLLTDPAYLSSILTTTHAVSDFKMPGWVENPTAGTKTVLHLQKTLSLLRVRMEDPLAWREESLLYCVFNLAIMAAGFGEWKAAIAHLGGLRRIVLLNGDGVFLARNPKLHFMLERIDLIWTLSSGKQPFFTHPPSTWEHIFPCPHPKPPTTTTTPSNPLSPPLHWHPHLSQTFTDLQTLAHRLNTSAQFHTPYNAKTFTTTLSTLQSRLLYLRDELQDPMQELMRLAMLAFMTTTFIVPGRKMPFNWVGERVGELLGSVLVGMEGEREGEFLVWALVVFGLTGIGVGEGWLREIWRSVGWGLDWCAVRGVLGRVMWVGVVLDGAGRGALEGLRGL